MDWRDIIARLSDEELSEYMLSLPKHQQERFARVANISRETKYPHSKRRVPKYGNLPRHFTHALLYRYLANIDDVHDLRDTLLEIIYGLRVGEVAHAEIVPGQLLVSIKNKKGARNGEERIEFMPLLPGTEVLFTPGGNPHYRHLSRLFNKTCDAVGAELGYSYGKSANGRPLYQFTTHSLRHTGAEIMYQYTDSDFKARVFLRHRPHKAIGVTATYVRYSLDHMRRDMHNAFAPLIRDWVR